MKQLTAKQKVICIVIIAIILAGISVICTTGFNLSLMYSNHKRIDVYIGKNFSLRDIKILADETFEGNKVLQTAEILDDYASVTVKDASEEQINNFKAKVAEKYNISEDLQSIKTTEVPSVNVIDVMKPYIFPITLTTVISTIYLAIRFREKNALKVCVKVISSLIIIEAIYFSIIAIVRIPFSDLIMPIGLLIYIVSLMCLVIKFKKDN